MPRVIKEKKPGKDDPPPPDIYVNCKKFEYNLKTRCGLATFYRKVRDELEIIPTISYRRILHPNEVVQLLVKSDESRKDERTLRLIMRKDNLYIIGFARSEDNGETFGTLYEICLKSQASCLHGATCLDISVSYSDFTHMRVFNTHFVEKAFFYLYNVEDPHSNANRDEVDLKLEVFYVFLPEGIRNGWLEEAFVNIMDWGVTQNLSTTWFTEQFNNWKVYTSYSREITLERMRCEQIFEVEEDEDLFANRKIELLHKNAPTRYLAAERILKVKCYDEKDWTPDGHVLFARNDSPPEDLLKYMTTAAKRAAERAAGR